MGTPTLSPPGLFSHSKSRPHVLILNSAQSKYPVGADPWVQATAKAIQNLAEYEIQIVCSTEPMMWDMVTYLSGLHKMTICLIVKSTDDKDGRLAYRRIMGEFSLDENRTFPLFLGKVDLQHPKELWRLRDRQALEIADIVYPVSLRPGGRLKKMLSEQNVRVKVRNDFTIPWSQGTYHPQYKLEDRSFMPLSTKDWLVHWTRASQGPWPGEKAWEFYRDLFAKPTIYIRGAAETLIRIVKENTIFGSSWRMPDGAAAVSFTALPPEDTVSLMRWRKRFVRYSFEPFGIAIKQNVLVEMGAREVYYTDQASINSDSRLFTQSPGKIGDWAKEKEWRIRGNLRLSDVNKNDLLILIPDESSAEYVGNKIDVDLNIHTLFMT